MKFDYEKEHSRDILCIDCKSFYASVECAERGLDPLKTMLVVRVMPKSGGISFISIANGKKSFRCFKCYA